MNLNFLQKINLYQSSLIDYANIFSGLLTPQNKFFSLNEINKFKKDFSLGIPILLPSGLDYFEYEDQDKIFELTKEEICNLIFSFNDTNYVGLKRIVANGLKFSSLAKPKKEFYELINLINRYNQNQKKLISQYKESRNTIAAFQTRNFPHSGHEAIIKYLLSKVDYVVVNPLIGAKKKGDVNYKTLIQSYEFLIDKKFSKKVLISPVIANFFYAGPREACHHAIIRKNLGYTHFSVGRDHAGAENKYDVNLASKTAKNLESKLNIKIIETEGAVYCRKCKKSVIKNICEHNDKDFIDISGNKFRENLGKKMYYEYADIDLQKYLMDINLKLFQE